MDAEHEIFSQFKSRAVQVGRNLDSTYFPIDVAEEIVRKCDELNIPVIGLEGFLLESGYVIPQIDAIEDFSRADKPDWESYVKNTNNLSRRILKEWRERTNLVACLTLGSKF